MQDQGTFPKRVANAMFKWLLKDPSEAFGEKTLEPEAVHAHIRDSTLFEAEILALWCYVDLSCRCDLSLAERGADLKRALSVSEGFAKLWEQNLPGLPNPGVGRDAARNLLLAPPADLVSGIVRTIGGYQVAEGRMAPRPLKGLHPTVFEHPADRMLLEKLRALPGAHKVLGSFLDKSSGHPEEVNLFASSLQVTRASLPKLHRIFLETAATLGLENPPRLYVKMGGLNAYTMGVNDPIVVVQSAAVDLLDEQEMRFVLGHELGHVMAGHVLYHYLGSLIASSSSALSGITLGLSRVLADTTFLSALNAWSRRSELTADRAGLLACQDLEAALRVNMKFTGFPAGSYPAMKTRTLVDQAIDFHRRVVGSSMDRAIDFLQVWEQQHPRTMIRALELVAWWQDGCYDDIVQAGPDQLRRMADRSLKDACLHYLYSAVSRELTQWAVTRFTLPRREAGRGLRAMIGDGQRNPGSPLNAIARIELSARKTGADKVEYDAEVLFQEGGKARQARVPIQVESEWDTVPSSFREEMIRNPTHPVSRLLYSIR